MVPETRILLRCFKRKSSTESGPHALDAESLYELEFVDMNGRPDVETSVYDIEPHEWCCVFLQRLAAVGNDPPPRAGGVDVRPVRADAEPEAEDWCFRLLREHHCIIRFAPEEVRPFVVELHRRMHDGTCAVFRHDRTQLRNWLHANMEDPEWAAFLANAKDTWRKYPKAAEGARPG